MPTNLFVYQYLRCPTSLKTYCTTSTIIHKPNNGEIADAQACANDAIADIVAATAAATAADAAHAADAAVAVSGQPEATAATKAIEAAALATAAALPYAAALLQG